MELLHAIIRTLEDVEVHGSENMSKLLGCINALNNIINTEEETAEKTTEE